MKRREFINCSALAGAGLLLAPGGVFGQGSRTPGATVQTSAGRLRERMYPSTK